MSEITVFAHRGYRTPQAYENSLEALAKAVELGYAIEFDVHRTADRELVIVHDDDMVRLLEDERYVKDVTLAAIRNQSRQSTKFKGSIPTLAEVLAFATTVPVNIELKTFPVPYRGIEKQVHDLIRYSTHSRYVISSFNHDTLERVKYLLPDIELAALTGDQLSRPWDYLKQRGFQAWHPNLHSLTAANVDAVHGEGIKIRTWTANKREDWERLVDLGVDGIFTDFPDQLTEYLKEQGV
jgi:glycerophosphoryl diester phosphodiesterase